MSREIKSLTPQQICVVKENSELATKIVSLEDYTSSAAFEILDRRQQSLLTQQLDTMKAYSHILALRISYF